MSSTRFLAPKIASMATAARPALRSSKLQFANPQRAISGSPLSVQARSSMSTSAFQSAKRQNLSSTLKSSPKAMNLLARQTIARPYSSELANALVEAGSNIGTGLAAIGLAGAGMGIGSVFQGLIQGLARNPSLKAQMFQYAILGFAFAEATGLFALMVAFMIRFT